MAATLEQAADALLVRNVTTIGHVDHGKTTLMDTLLAANNIISYRMAGKVRYLDSREDEQQRGITMESSAVSLRFQVLDSQSTSGPGLAESSKTYVINMIDTPGHVDFSSEVSTASRLCDGALVLVDVVEGVCTQTIAVLRQAWMDRLRPILVINKLDRLITELKLSPIEAYHHLSQLIEQVNAVMGSFFAGERMEDDLRWREERERRLAAKREAMAEEAAADAAATPNGSVNGDAVPDAEADGHDDFQEKDDEDLYFAPERGNVVFASAIDGWGFRIGKFAQLYAKKLRIREATFKRVLWGDFYLDVKTKRVISHKQLKGRNLKPLFVQFVLENIWAVYDAIVLNPNPDKVSKIITTLNLKIPPREIKSKDTRSLLQLVFSQWLSLSTCVIQATIDVIPPPSSAQLTRIPKILYPDLLERTIAPKSKLERDLWSCDDGSEAFVIVYVSKMFAVPVKELPENKKAAVTAEQLRANAKAARERAAAATAEASGVSSPTSVEASRNQGDNSEGKEKEEINEEEDVLLGFARIYSGTIRVGSKVRCVLPKYNNNLPPAHPRNAPHTVTTVIEGLYTMMGKDIVRVDSIPAGNVFAIRGLEGKVMRSATICAPDCQGLVDEEAEEGNTGYILNLGGVLRPVYPIVRVALEPRVPGDMLKLVKGLKLLSQADPCVETFQQQTGEHVILTAGELHLERCLKDLRERFAKVEIQASKPIVPFRETAVKATEMAPPKYSTKRGLVNGSSAQGLVKFSIRAAPLPKSLLEFILDNISILKRIQRERRNAPGGPAEGRDQDRQGDDYAGPERSYDDSGETFRKPTVRPEQFWTRLEEACKKVGGDWDKGIVDRIWAFGPHEAGGCLLVDARKNIKTPNSLRKRLDRTRLIDTSMGALKISEDGVAEDELRHDFDHHIETGFQLATFQGPLCSEPVEGMVYFLESLEMGSEETKSETGAQQRYAQVSGSLMTAVRDACRNGFLDWSPRLMLAMYSCDIQASTDVLGKVYGVVAKRRGRIVSEEMKEGTSFFTVSALLPVAESFGFADDIRKRTSGAASPQLIFSGYEMLDLDPFWVPTTEEELEDLGEKADRENVAKVYMDSVRERKGLFVDRKIVEFAEKQRTLKR